MARKYKKNRVSRKGKTRYQIYLDKRRKLEEEGYVLRPVTPEDVFNRRYENAKKAGFTNFMRDYPKYDRYSNKEDFYDIRRKIKSLDLNDKPQAEIYNEYIDMTFEDLKKWDNETWIKFRDELIGIGVTFDEFRGIYE